MHETSADLPGDLPGDELRRLLALRHPDPHSILGAHPLDGDQRAEGARGGLVVRALRPDAEAVWLLLDDEGEEGGGPGRSGGPALPMRLRHPAGLFEAVLPARQPPHRLPLRYRLEVHERGGRVYTVRSPYAFLPTLGELDLHLLGEGTHARPYDKLGAHVIEQDGVRGVAFAVWAPAAEGVSVVGDFNGWDGRLDPMRLLGGSGIWELFVPDLDEGALYKFEVRTRGGGLVLKSDPFAFAMELPPSTASIVSRPHHRFLDEAWMEARARGDLLRRPLSILEVHLGSWRRVPEEGDRMLSYRELASSLGDYAADMGFTHVELLPVMEHPFAGSWGYQVSGYFAPTARHGSPDDFRYFVDELHRRGVGVLLDWVPAHFPKDAFCLGRFDGTALYEHLDPRQGEHPDWGTFVFNFGRNEVRSFLLASADWWLSSFHIDGLRVDAVASMIYLDYSRREGEWIPNRYGGRENLEAISFLRTLGEEVHGRHPGALLVAEESTAWPGVSRPTYVGGLGFGFKWDMGWMHDTLAYFQKDPIHRRYHHDHLTFGFLYAWSENFVLPLSHDEVVHGKGALLAKMPGDRWQRFANLRALYGYMWARPGKKLLFMGGELGQWREWNHDQSLDWHLLEESDHRGVQSLVRELNRLYRDEPALWEADVDPAGFQWIDPHDADDNVIAFARWAPSSGRVLLSACNFSPVVRGDHRVGVPLAGAWRVVLDTDEERWGGSGARRGYADDVVSEPVPWHGCAQSVRLRLPPLGVLWLTPL